MNDRFLLLLVVTMSVGFQFMGKAQQSFQNLDFEAAHNIPSFAGNVHPWSMPASNALPGWTCYVGSNLQTTVWYDDLALDGAGLGIINSTSPYAPADLVGGQYCASLQYGITAIYPGNPLVVIREPASISQVGEIPSDAQSMHFIGTIPFSVSFDGNLIPLVVLDAQTTYNVYGGDVSLFAGQVGELRFMSYSHFAFLDSIGFSSQSIPEPNTFCIVLLGLLVLYRNHR